MEPFFVTLRSCPLCQDSNIEPILDLGAQPPANSLRSSRNEELPCVPLRLFFCHACKGVFIGEQIDPKYLFNEYVWVTGTSAAARRYSEKFYQEALRRNCPKQLFVVEVASNDGTFLMPFKDNGHRVLGIDPAENIVQIAQTKGVDSLAEFFTEQSAKEVTRQYGHPDFVFARNVIPHVKNIHDVMAGLQVLLNEDSVGAIEFHYSKVILDELHYDSIYHEHLYYFSLRSITNLLRRSGIFVFDAFKSPISGGSLVVYFSNKQRIISRELETLIGEEEGAGVNSFAAWKEFASRCEAHKCSLTRMITEDVKAGKRIIGYGASARSSTLLNYCGINWKDLLCVADQNPLKHGKYTAGTDIIILPPEEALARRPDGILLLAWNFAEEILERLKTEFQFRGSVIVPLPNEIRTFRTLQ